MGAVLLDEEKRIAHRQRIAFLLYSISLGHLRLSSILGLGMMLKVQNSEPSPVRSRVIYRLDVEFPAQNFVTSGY